MEAIPPSFNRSDWSTIAVSFLIAAVLLVALRTIPSSHRDQARTSLATLQQPIGEWSWKDSHSQKRTRAELREILRLHKLWLDSKGNSGVRADLHGADFTSGLADNATLLGSELAGVDLERADLREINLSFANLSRVNLRSAKLKQAILAVTWLAHADLSDADLSGAFLTLANLSNAELVGTELKDADFYGANMAHAVFEPKSIPEVVGIGGAGNLESMMYIYFPNSLTMLRKQFEATGLRQQEREITYAVRHTEAAHLLDVDTPAPILMGNAEGLWQSLKTEGRLMWKGCGESSLNCVGYLFDRMFFDFTCHYGMDPGRPLRLLVGLWLLCSFVYASFTKHGVHSGLFLVGKRVWKGKEYVQGIRIRPQEIRPVSMWKYPYYSLLREWRIYRAAMFFSLMSAFNIGFRDINFGRWIRLLTRKEYDIKAKGWARTVAGVQSLVSVYLVALWVLTYFGRPFE